MEKVRDLPIWAERLHRALRATESDHEILRSQLALTEDDDWLATALEGKKEPTPAQYALLSAATHVPATILAGIAPFERDFGVALRAGALCADSAVSRVVDRAASVLADLGLLLAWYSVERSKQAEAMALAVRARSGQTHSGRAGEHTAQRLRDLFDLSDGPIADLSGFVERLGVPVLLEEMPTDIHGINVHERSGVRNDSTIMVNTRDWWGRQRFTLAHEVCHVIYGDAEVLNVNRHNSDTSDPREQRANAFARHFLAPSSAVRRFWGRDSARPGDRLAEFMIEFGLSRQASIIAICEATNIPRSAFDPCVEVPVAVLMTRSGLREKWDQLCEAQGHQQTSPLMLDLALDAYASGLVSHEVVASVLDRPDADNVRRELEAHGWSPVS